MRAVIPLRRIRDRMTERGRKQLLSRLPKASIGAEVGVWRGDFAEKILRVVDPLKIYLVDPWQFFPELPDAWYGGAVAKSPEDMEAIFHDVSQRFAGDARVEILRATSLKAAERLSNESLDWVYVDGNHLYDSVKSDLETYWCKLRHGGLLTGDDYGSVGWRQTNVRNAVDEFAQRNGLRLSIVGQQFVIEKPQIRR